MSTRDTARNAAIMAREENLRAERDIRRQKLSSLGIDGLLSRLETCETERPRRVIKI
jgi:hypothetical protein